MGLGNYVAIPLSYSDSKVYELERNIEGLNVKISKVEVENNGLQSQIEKLTAKVESLFDALNAYVETENTIKKSKQ